MPIAIGTRLNDRGLVYTCLTFVVGSIIIAPVCVHMGIKSETASILSSLSLLGGIVTALIASRAMGDFRENDASGSRKRH